MTYQDFIEKHRITLTYESIELDADTLLCLLALLIFYLMGVWR